MGKTLLRMSGGKGTVSEAAKDIFGIDSTVGVQKAKQWRDALEAGAIDRIIGELEPFRTRKPEAATCIKYLQTNRHRMRYPAFRKQGLCTSSGVLEAGCKVSIGARLKCAGMHWSLKGANAIIALHCCRLSSRFDDYWSRRATIVLYTASPPQSKHGRVENKRRQNWIKSVIVYVTVGVFHSFGHPYNSVMSWVPLFYIGEGEKLSVILWHL